VAGVPLKVILGGCLLVALAVLVIRTPRLGSDSRAVAGIVGCVLGVSLLGYAFAGWWYATHVVPPIFTGDLPPDRVLAPGVWASDEASVGTWGITVALLGLVLIGLAVTHRLSSESTLIVGLTLLAVAGATYWVATFSARMHLADYADGVLAGPFPPLGRVLTAIAATAAVFALVFYVQRIRARRRGSQQGGTRSVR
jgi:hypothetical protein